MAALAGERFAEATRLVERTVDEAGVAA